MFLRAGERKERVGIALDSQSSGLRVWKGQDVGTGFLICS